MKLTFFAKVFGLTLGLAGVVIVLSNATFHFTAERVLVSGLGEEALDLAEWAASEIETDPSPYQRLLDGSLTPAEGKPLIDTQLRGLQKELGPRGVENVYVLVSGDGRMLVLGDPDPDSSLPLTEEDTLHFDLKRGVQSTGVATATPEPYVDEYGTWISAYAPIRVEGEPIAIIGVDLPLGAFPLIDRIITRNILISLVPAIAVVLLASFYASRRLTEPIRRLTEGLRRVESGHLEVQLEPHSEDELGEMTEAFNNMTRGLQEKERFRTMLQHAVSKEIADAMVAGGVSTEGALVDATVLFADIRGFTAFSETVPAREVIAMVNAYLTALVPAVTDNGGVVEKYVGDEIVAVFGAPLELPDDAMAAVRAALSMRMLLEALNETRIEAGKPAINIGIGVNTGAVVAGVVGSADRHNYTVLGSAVNEGARLCSAAAPGQILISQSTFLRVDNRVEVNALPALKVRGTRFPLTVFEVVGLKDHSDG